jgi:hypothetical protein
MTNLVTAIDLAQAANEKRIAAEINAPKHKLDDSEALAILRSFAGWCSSRGVKWLPATPATCAAWIRFQDASVPVETIEKAIGAIEAVHDQHGYANPIATAAVRAELGRILKLEAPRSWPKADRLKFNSLPIEVRAVIERRASQDSLALRRLQNRVAELRKGKLQCRSSVQIKASMVRSPTTKSF